MSKSIDIKQIITDLPKKPGVYQFLDEKGTIIYIGKAKSLKSRVSSYFMKGDHGSRTKLLIKKIRDIRYIVVDSEQDALLLENNLIKKYKPRYNVLLKDDKSYPWITVTNEPYPRVFITRRFIRNGSEYYGPYTSVKLAHLMMDLVKSLFKVRSCKLNITEKGVYASKFKVCLEYHLNNCDAPCVGNISIEEYNDNIAHIKHLLNGNISEVIRQMYSKMKEYSTSMQFEKAQQTKESIERLKSYRSKSTIVRRSISNIDIFSFKEEERYAYVNYLRIVHGAVNQVHTVEIEKKLEESNESLLSYAIFEIRQLVNSTSNEIVVPFLPDVMLEGVNYLIPKRGEKKELLELSERNALYFKNDRRKQRGVVKKEESKLYLLTTIRDELHLPMLPHRIECIDNSNIQGTNPVASCVVFLDGKPAKSEYRRFHVKSVEGADDFASMEEIVYRRYSRVLDEGRELPDLIVVDGGKGQLNAAINSLKILDLEGKVSIVGLAERMEEIYFPGDSQPYILGKNSLTLNILMQIRDEAHRFGITFHRKLREKDQIDSELHHIKGIGEKTEVKLLQHFKSVLSISKATLRELTDVIGTKKAEIIYAHFHSLVNQD